MSYYQNPTGILLSEARRAQLMEVIRDFNRKEHFYVAEDTAYRELRYDGADIPSLRSLDDQGEIVCYLGTFSKPFSPGLKTGFGLLPEALLEPVLRFKGNHDFGSANFSQHLLDRAMERGLFESHVAELKRAYRHKRDAMLTALEQFMPPDCTITRSDGGLYVWLARPEGVRTGTDSALFETALERGVLYVPGEYFYAEDCKRPVETHQLRLSFGVGSPDKLREGVRRLGEAVREVCDG